MKRLVTLNRFIIIPEIRASNDTTGLPSIIDTLTPRLLGQWRCVPPDASGILVVTRVKDPSVKVCHVQDEVMVMVVVAEVLMYLVD